MTGIVLGCGIPAALLAVAGGWWLMRQLPAPVAGLAQAAGRITARNSGDRLPRTANGDELDPLAGIFNVMLGRLDDSFNRIREFTIANSGPGIPPAVLPRVFDRCFRGDPAHRNTVDGCGLGLSIAQWIVFAHHGTIQTASAPNDRTTVPVRLPLT